MSDGAMGGKGRGLAFVNSLIYNFDFSTICSSNQHQDSRAHPFIGTDEFEYFIDHNNLHESDHMIMCLMKRLKVRFLEGKLTPTLTTQVKGTAST
ncbi:MAG: hypothetical protein MZV63_55930 [Marinilabiliales bacterium]|nr:hypothetical protein [Marinilabiliales bacterium]